MILKGATLGLGLFELLSEGLRLPRPTDLGIGSGHLGGDFRDLVGKRGDRVMKAPGKVVVLKQDLPIRVLGPCEQVAGHRYRALHRCLAHLGLALVIGTALYLKVNAATGRVTWTPEW